MNTLITIFSAICLVGSPIGHKNVTYNADGLRSVQHNTFAPGERLRYRMQYGYVDAGESIFEVMPTAKKVAGREIWHVKATGRTLGAFDLFYRVRDVYRSYIDAEGVFPWVFIRRVDEGGYIIEQDYTFYQKQKKVDTGNGKKFDVPDHVQDMISSFYYARTLDFSNAQPGDIFEVKTFLDEELFPMKVKYVGKEDVKLRKGTFSCLKFRPVVQKGRVFKSEEDMVVYITDDGNKIPVMASAKIRVGTVRMQLVEWENLSNPLAFKE